MKGFATPILWSTRTPGLHTTLMTLPAAYIIRRRVLRGSEQAYLRSIGQ